MTSAGLGRKREGGPTGHDGGDGATTVHLHLFGRVRLSVGDRVLDDRAFPSRKAKQVLTLLALARGAAVSKDRLVELIWGDRLPRNPTATLEHTVSILRAACLDVGVRSVIVTVNGGYRLDTATVIVDVVRIEQLVRAAGHATPEDALVMLGDAVALAGGELLEDEPAAEWASTAREELRRTVERAALDAARLALIADDPDVALELARRAQVLAVVPSEDAFHLEASALVRLGRRADALVLLRDAEGALERELGAGLPPATIALRELLRSPITATMRPSSLRLDLPPITGSRLMPFVGRRRELVAVDEAIVSIRAGGSPFALFTGPAGLGKTRLLDELGRAPGGVTAYRLTCTMPGRALPRFTASRLYRALAGSAGADRHRATTPDAATVLYEQLDALICSLGPSVALIDDLHWADDESLAIVGALAGRSGIGSFGIVATARPGDHSSTRRVLPGEQHELRPLPDVDLVAAGCQIDSAVAGGVPIVIAACLEHHRDGHLSAPTVDALVARTLEPGPMAHEVLLVAAAAGALGAGLSEIAFTLGLAPELVAALVDRLHAHHLVVARDGCVLVRDDVTRQVLLAIMGPDRVRSVRSTLGIGGQSATASAASRVG